MVCKFDDDCFLFSSCGHKDMAEFCSLHKHIASKLPEVKEKLSKLNDFKIDDTIIFNPYDLNEPTP